MPAGCRCLRPCWRAQASLLQVRSHLTRAWTWEEVPGLWQLDALAKWMALPGRPWSMLSTAAVTAWQNQLLDEFFRCEFDV